MWIVAGVSRKLGFGATAQVAQHAAYKRPWNRSKLRQHSNQNLQAYIISPQVILRSSISTHQTQCSPPSSPSSTTATAVAPARALATAARTAPATTAPYVLLSICCERMRLTLSRRAAVAAERQRLIYKPFDLASMARRLELLFSGDEVCHGGGGLQLRYQTTIESKS
jgi:hypothetical protein